MFDNSKIELKGGEYLGPGIHEVTLFDVSTEFFTNKDGIQRKKIKIQFKNNHGIHFEDFIVTETTLWRLKLLSMACGIPENGRWTWEDVMGKGLIIHLKQREYTDRNGEKGRKCEISKFEKSTNKGLQKNTKDDFYVDENGYWAEPPGSVPTDPF